MTPVTHCYRVRKFLSLGVDGVADGACRDSVKARGGQKQQDVFISVAIA